ncbi:MAG: polyprenyl synthetase family protein [Paludibacteraceae bacterium]|nr:polyprenyl synthetase family protein [Paludibacteraceae bacterium]
MSFSEIQNYVRQQLAKYKFKKEPQGLYEPIAYELVEIGGKRLRPAFTLFACQLYCGEVQPALSAALGLEMFHNFTLLHDDIMDNADKRRGKPTVHKVWDENTAILSGDTMMAKAYELIAKTKNKYMPAVLKHFNETVIGVMEGQQYDMNFEESTKVSINNYMEMIRLKTAVLLAGSLKIGAICGGADKKNANALYDFGIGVGLSFQLCDDILDVYGDTEVFGKNIGGDIVENKKTYLYLKALELAKGTPDEEALINWFSKETFDRDKKIKAVTDIYNRLNVKKATEDEMNRQYEVAVKALEKTTLNDEQKSALVKLANDLLKRES